MCSVALMSFSGISVDQQQIRLVAFLDQAHAIVHAQQFARRYRLRPAVLLRWGTAGPTQSCNSR